MAKTWAEVSASEQYLSLGEQDREAARRQYFDEVVAPRVDPAEVQDAWAQFDADTRESLKASDAPKDFDAAGDTARLLGAGALDLVRGVSTTAQEGMTASVPGKMLGLAAELGRRKLFGNAPVRDLAKEATEKLEAGMSQRVQEASRKEFITEGEDGYGLGDAWSDPLSYYALITRSVPSMIGPLLNARKSAKDAFEETLDRALKRGESREVAEQLARDEARKAATLSAGTTEAAVAGGMSKEQTVEEVMKLPEETLLEHPDYRALLERGMSRERAREIVADRAGDVAMGIAGPAAGVLGSVGGRFLGDLVGDGAGGVASRMARGGVAEGITEGASGGIEQAATNLGVQLHADQDRDLMEGVANAAVSGKIAGTAMGAGMGALPTGSGRPSVEGQSEEGADQFVAGMLPAPARIVFPDGTVASSMEEVERYLVQFPEEERVARRAELLGYARQEGDAPAPTPAPADALPAPTADELAAGNQVPRYVDEQGNVMETPYDASRAERAAQDEVRAQVEAIYARTDMTADQKAEAVAAIYGMQREGQRATHALPAPSEVPVTVNERGVASRGEAEVDARMQDIERNPNLTDAEKVSARAATMGYADQDARHRAAADESNRRKAMRAEIERYKQRAQQRAAMREADPTSTPGVYRRDVDGATVYTMPNVPGASLTVMPHPTMPGRTIESVELPDSLKGKRRTATTEQLVRGALGDGPILRRPGKRYADVNTVLDRVQGTARATVAGATRAVSEDTPAARARLSDEIEAYRRRRAAERAQAQPEPEAAPQERTVEQELRRARARGDIDQGAFDEAMELARAGDETYARELLDAIDTSGVERTQADPIAEDEYMAVRAGNDREYRSGLPEENVDTEIAIGAPAHAVAKRRGRLPDAVTRRDHNSYDANPEQLTRIAEAVGDVVRAAPWLGRAADQITAWGLHEGIWNPMRRQYTGDMARHWVGSRAITIRSDVLSDSMADEGVAKKLRGYIAHELAHRADSDMDGGMLSDQSPLFEITPDADGFPVASGEIAIEAMTLYANQPESEVALLLRYPFNAVGQDAFFYRTELFAQLGRLFTTNPALMKKELPRAYSLFERIADQGWNKATAGIVPSAAGVQGEVRGAGAAASVPGRHRADGAGDRADSRGNRVEHAPAARDGRSRDGERFDPLDKRGIRRVAKRLLREANPIYDRREPRTDARGHRAGGPSAGLLAEYTYGGQVVAHEINDAARYHKLISDSKRAHPLGAQVYVYDADEYRNMRLWITPDGKAGVALKPDGDMVSVFADPDSQYPVHNLILIAAQAGAKKADAFATVLPDLYRDFGFRPVARMAWNDEYSPSDWNKQTFAKWNGGEPDVAFLVFDPHDKLGAFESAMDVLQSLPYTEDYDAAVQAQTDAIEQIGSDESQGVRAGSLRDEVRRYADSARSAITNSPAFKRWFGKSKITNPDGTPKVMYHGTARDIEAFRPKQADAIFLTEDPGFAEQFTWASQSYVEGEVMEGPHADAIRREVLQAWDKENPISDFPGGKKQRDAIRKSIEERPWEADGFSEIASKYIDTSRNIVPLYVKAENPFDFASREHRAAVLNELFKPSLTVHSDGSTSMVHDGAIEIAGEGYERSALNDALRDGDWAVIESKPVQDAIKALGHDGFYVSEAGRKNLAVYKPTQVKSATGNRGTFDPNDDRIQAVRSGAESQPAKSIRAAYRKRADSIISALDNFLDPLGHLPEKDKYLTFRYRTLGAIAKWEQIGKGIYDTLSKASAADAKAVYDYLTTAGADTSKVKDPIIAKRARETKDTIRKVGESLVSRGLLRKEVFEKNKDSYLPRMYLAHLLEERDFRAIAGGRKPSNMGYLKQRKDLSEESRILLGEVKDPAFLSATGITRAMRDLFLIRWLEEIAGNDKWVLPNSLADWKGQKVSAQWLKNEAEALRARAAHMPDPEHAKLAVAESKKMDEAADAALAGIEGSVTKDYKQIPDTPRYGMLRGMWVRDEIHQDLVGLGDLSSESGNFLQSVFGYGGIGTRATQMWKTVKVTLNPPSQIRNIISNMVMLQLSGIALHRLPGRIIEAAKQIAARDGKHYNIAKKYGVFEGTFSSQELFRMRRQLLDLEARTKGLTPLGQLRRIASAIVNGAGDAYQFFEVLGKTAKIIDVMEHEKGGEERAVLEAQKWLFDYSLIPNTVRYARNAPIGAPFLTYIYKAAPRMVEVALHNPQRFLPWVALFSSLSMWAVQALGLDDEDDIEKIKKSLPEYMREKSHLAVLPYRDEHGRIQVLDLGYYFPWAPYVEAAQAIGKGDIKEATKALGLLGGPIPDALIAFSTNKDSFTGRDIVNEADPPARQWGARLGYMWNMAVPPWMSSYGPVASAINIDETDRYGNPKKTPGQVIGSVFGATYRSFDPDLSRAENIRRGMADIRDVQKRLRSKLQDQSLSEERRQKLIVEYVNEIERRQQELSKYIEETDMSR